MLHSVHTLASIWQKEPVPCLADIESTTSARSLILESWYIPALCAPSSILCRLAFRVTFIAEKAGSIPPRTARVLAKMSLCRSASAVTWRGSLTPGRQARPRHLTKNSLGYSLLPITFSTTTVRQFICWALEKWKKSPLLTKGSCNFLLHTAFHTLPE